MVLKYIGKSGLTNPTTVVVEVVQEIQRMADMVKINLEESSKALIDKEFSTYKEVYARENI